MNKKPEPIMVNVKINGVHLRTRLRDKMDPAELAAKTAAVAVAVLLRSLLTR